MALPLTTVNAQAAFGQFQQRGAAVHTMSQQVTSATSIPSNVLATLLSQVNGLVAFVNSINADPTAQAAVIAYVQSITGSTTVQTDFAASHTALLALQAAIIKDYPVDANGHVLDRTIDANGNITWVNFTPTQLSNTIPAITNWLSTVA